MKKLLGIVVLGLLLSGNAYSKEISLECGSKDEFENMLYVKVDKKKFEIYQPSSANRVIFKTSKFDDYIISTIPRGLDKASTGHDTYLTDWKSWDESKFIKDYIYSVGIERVQGYIAIARSTEPWVEGKKYTEYDFKIFWDLKCKELKKKF
tara:strand:+ start:236 stop:688 length:453 start_codon:yes stop_codon:yes gene_type:complete